MPVIFRPRIGGLAKVFFDVTYCTRATVYILEKSARSKLPRHDALGIGMEPGPQDTPWRRRVLISTIRCEHMSGFVFSETFIRGKIPLTTCNCPQHPDKLCFLFSTFQSLCSPKVPLYTD